MADHYNYPLNPIPHFQSADALSTPEQDVQYSYTSYSTENPYAPVQPADMHHAPSMTASSSVQSFSPFMTNYNDSDPLFHSPNPSTFSDKTSRASQVFYSSAMMHGDDERFLSSPRQSSPFETQKAKGRRRKILFGLGILLLLILLVFLPIYFIVIKQSSSKADQTEAQSSSTNDQTPGIVSVPSVPSKSIATSGSDGSSITLDDGSSFVYRNSFGGSWDADPTSLKAQAQSWTVPLENDWDFGQTRMMGVNLGGWLVTEPFIVPSLYESIQMSDGSTPIDEWNLMVALGSKAQSVMDNHYATFITEQDFAEIAAAGLNWIRLPIPYWMVETLPNEPFYTGGCFPYFVKALNWARKYGLRVNLDLHSVSGSQNGWNHSGREGGINFLKGADGVFNSERTLEVIRTITEFIMQDEYKDIVKMFGVINEPRAYEMSQEALMAWYLQAHDIIRAVTGMGQGPLIIISDGLLVPSVWTSSSFEGFDRMVLDTHLYIAFEERIVVDFPNTIPYPCTQYGPAINSSFVNFGFTIGGEVSVAINDCGKWLNGVTKGSVFDGSSEPGWIPNDKCDYWLNSDLWTDDTKQSLKSIALTTFDSIQSFFYWTWKTGISIETNATANPMWNYQLGLKLGYIPSDPRDSIGICQEQYSNVAPTPNPHPTVTFQTGTIPPAIQSQNPWPPISIGPPSSLINAQFLPTMTKTGTPISLTLPSPSVAPGISITMPPQNGWANTLDTSSAYVTVEGCTISDLWGDPVTKPLPTAACTGRI